MSAKFKQASSHARQWSFAGRTQGWWEIQDWLEGIPDDKRTSED